MTDKDLKLIKSGICPACGKGLWKDGRRRRGKKLMQHYRCGRIDGCGKSYEVEQP